MVSSFTMEELEEETRPVWSTSIPPIPSWWWCPWLKVIPFTSVVSFASALAVMVVGKNTVAVPLVFFGDPPFPPPPAPAPPGDIMVKGDTGILPNFEISSMKLEPLPKGELTRFAEVGSPWEVRGKAPPTMVCGEGGGRVGVFGREPGMGGAKVKGE